MPPECNASRHDKQSGARQAERRTTANRPFRCGRGCDRAHGVGSRRPARDRRPARPRAVPQGTARSVTSERSAGDISLRASAKDSMLRCREKNSRTRFWNSRGNFASVMKALTCTHSDSEAVWDGASHAACGREEKRQQVPWLSTMRTGAGLAKGRWRAAHTD